MIRLVERTTGNIQPRTTSVLAMGLVGFLAVAAPGGDAPATGPAQQALLIGCTEYPNSPAIPELYGPGNDIPAWLARLTDPKGLAFPADGVTVLLGWPADPARRPTRANIAAAFESLAARSGPDDRVFILFSGHGAQIPIPAGQDPFDPNNFEPDGLDEIFLPADTVEGEEGPLNAIKDDEIGLWLDKIRGKGAHVLIVFDCCHSGTMARGDDLERPRLVRAQALGVKDERLADAARRAGAARKQAEAAGRDVEAEERERARARAGRDPGPGSLVAIYAAQPFETAPELPMPEGAPRTKDHYFGLLSYTLLQALEQRRGPISYQDFARMLASRYRANRGNRAPTPFCEGDLDRELLGLRRWPARADLVLDRDRGKLRVGGGELLGITPGSVLAVRRPAGSGLDEDEVLGHVRVASATATSAIVRPTAFAGRPAPPEETLPDLGRCEPVSRDFGDMRVKLFADGSPAVAAALGALAPQVRDLIDTGLEEDKAAWVLRTFAADRAAEEFGLRGLVGDHVLLLQGRGRKLANEARTPPDGGPDAPRKVFASYPAGNPSALASSLERDLPKVFKWQNVWRVAGGVAAQDGGETHGLRFEVALLEDEDDRTGGKLLRDPVLRDGQNMEFRLKNEGVEDLWVTLLYLDANLGIEQYWTGSLRQGAALKPFRTAMNVKDNSTGVEGMIVMALPLSVQRVEPDFRFLEQQPLRVPEARGRGADPSPATPFGRLMAAAALDGGTREMERRVPSTPAILSQSWILLNKKP